MKNSNILHIYHGWIQDFKLGGGGGGGVHLEKLGVFRVKNHNFTPKNHIISNLRRAPPSPLYIIAYNI